MGSHDDLISEKEVLEVSQEGHFYNSKWRHLAEILEDFPSASKLELHWIPPSARNDDACHYMVRSIDKQGTPYVIMLLTEDTEPEDVVFQLIQGQQRSNNDPYRAMQARNFARKLLELKKMEDEIEQRKDVTRWLLETKKSNPVMRDIHTGEMVKFDSGLNKRNIRSHH